MRIHPFILRRMSRDHLKEAWNVAFPSEPLRLEHELETMQVLIQSLLDQEWLALAQLESIACPLLKVIK